MAKKAAGILADVESKLAADAWGVMAAEAEVKRTAALVETCGEVLREAAKTREAAEDFKARTRMAGDALRAVVEARAAEARAEAEYVKADGPHQVAREALQAARERQREAVAALVKEGLTVGAREALPAFTAAWAANQDLARLWSVLATVCGARRAEEVVTPVHMNLLSPDRLDAWRVSACRELGLESL